MLRGVAVPLVTPFSESGAVCAEGVATLSGFVGRHVAAVIPCLTTGEGWLLSDMQWHDMVKYCLEYFGRDRVIAGIELPTTELAVARTKLAADLGCTSVISTKPFGPHVSQDEILRHYITLTQDPRLKVFAYNESWLSKNALTTDSFIALSGIEGIAGIKESTGDPVLSAWLSTNHEKIPPVYQGREELLRTSIEFDGSMVALANLEPELCANAFRAPKQEWFDAADHACRAHGLLSDQWIRKIKAELFKRQVIQNPTLAADGRTKSSMQCAARPSQHSTRAEKTDWRSNHA